MNSAGDLDTRAGMALQKALDVTKQYGTDAPARERLVHHQNADTADRMWAMEDGRDEGRNDADDLVIYESHERSVAGRGTESAEVGREAFRRQGMAEL